MARTTNAVKGVNMESVGRVESHEHDEHLLTPTKTPSCEKGGMCHHVPGGKKLSISNGGQKWLIKSMILARGNKFMIME